MNKDINNIEEAEVIGRSSQGIKDTTQSNEKVVKSVKVTDIPLKRRKFVKYYSEGETMGNGTKSAIKAGYSEDSAASQASRLLKDHKVLALLNSNIEGAERVISDIMTNGDSDSVRLAAAKELLDRTIGKPIQRSISAHVNVTVESMLGED